MTNPTSDYPTGIFTSKLSGREAFLADHVIQGQRVLPGMAYLEMARAAVALSAGVGEEQMVVLGDTVFIQPLVVQEETAVEVRVYPGASGEFGVEVLTAQGVHFQSGAAIRDRAPDPRLDLRGLAERCSAAVSREEVYADFRRRGISYGPSHQSVQGVRLGDGCALAELHVAGSSRQGMDLHPGMLDGISQVAVVLAGQRDGISVPFAIRSARIHGPLTDRMHAYLVQTDKGFDCAIADESGEVRVSLTGFAGRELDLTRRQDEVVHYRPEWQDAADVAADAEVAVIPPQAGYGELVQAVIETAQRLIREKAARAVLEVRVPADQPAWLGIVALLKTIQLEHSKLEWRLRHGDRFVRLGYRPLELPEAPAFRWRDGQTVLITGGQGGLGMILAEDIARTAKGATLILAGRSAPDPDKIARLEARGARVIAARCDVTDRAGVASLVAQYPDITGVIHGAGVLDDSLLVDKTADGIGRVLAPKVQGLIHLDEATAALPLEFFIALSSIAGTMGNAGQADYAAANGFMDAYMQQRAQRARGKSLSINWPLWESGGMQVDEATKQNLLQVFKLKPLPTAAGLAALKQILGGSEAQVLVLYGNRKAIGAALDKTAAAPQRAAGLRVETSRLAREILKEVKIRTAEHLSLRLPPNQLDEEADWAEFGFDSIILSSFVNKLNAAWDLDLMPTALFEATNMLRFSQYLAEAYPQQMASALSLTGEQQAAGAAVAQEPEARKISAFAQSYRKAYGARVAYREKDVAIVGMSCRIAGARNPEELWRVLEDERDMITEIPRERWEWEAYPDAARWGSFIDGVDEFDSLFFGISPAEAAYIVPEQRLMMQSVWECLEDAGCGDAIKGTNTGIFVGIAPSGYTSLLTGVPIESYSSTGVIPSVGPNRISYLMDWHGPSEPIETACSSSLVAVHRAVEAIRAGHCDQAIAGGVNLLLTPDAYVSFTKAGMLCEDGRCKTFSDKANGYVRGEGIGMILLKPLEAALQDGNRIHAVIKGTAENHGGRTNSLTAPNPKSQTAVVRKAVRDAEVDFSRISYIECHGTGTELGDPVEIEGLKMAAAQLLDDDAAAQTCRLGSIKSNIGHLEIAAGIAGLIKVVLQMQHRKIVRTLHCDTVNPMISLAGSPFAIAQRTMDWDVPPGQTRVAGVSSFGFGGVNAHVVLEELPQPPAETEDADAGPDARPQLLVISARNEEALLNYVAQYPEYVRSLPRTRSTLGRVAYTLQVGRSEMQERVAFLAQSLDEWAEQLDSFVRNRGKVYHRNIFRGTVGSGNSLDVADTDAGRDYIRQLMNGNECGKLADLWVKGTKIDWKALHG